MNADAQIKPHEANQMVFDALDLLVQKGVRYEVRRVIEISNVAKDLKNVDVFFELIYRNIGESSEKEPRQEKVI